MEEYLTEKVPFFKHSGPGGKLLILLATVFAGAILSLVISEAILLLGANAGLTVYSLGFIRIYQTLSSICIFLLPALIFSYLSDRKWFSYNSSTRLPSANSCGIVIFISLFIIVSVGLLAYLNEQMRLPDFLSGIETWMREQEDKANAIIELLIADKSYLGLLLNLGVMAVVPAICEEYLFRGTIQPFLSRWIKNEHAAIWITAFVFSAIHLQFYGFIPRLLLGAYLGYLMIWSRSIWLPVLAHFLHNAISVIFSFYSESSDMELENIGLENFSTLMPFIVMSAIASGIGIYMLYRRRIRN